MTVPDAAHGWRLWLLCLMVASLLWLALASERTAQMVLTVPLHLVRLPRDLRVASPVPPTVQLTVSGPRLVLFRQECRGLACRVDLSGLSAGTAAFPVLEQSLDLDSDLKVTRIFPASLSVTLAPASR